METRIIRRARAVVGLVATTGLALALTSCSSGGGGGAAEETTPAAEEADDWSGPLSKMFQEVYEDFGVDDMNAQQARMEQVVAECMGEQGWEYTPVDHGLLDEDFGAPVDDDGPEWGTQEYAEQLGYGISTWESDAEETSGPLPDEAEWDDPNMAYVESLSEAAQEEYYLALHGPQPTAEELESGEWEYDPANAGCYGKASEEVFNAGGESFWEDPRFEALIEDMNQIYDSVEDDPRIAELRAGWVGCMADAGYPGLAEPADAQDSILTEYEALWGQGGEPDEAQLAALREKERAIALADFRCADEFDETALMIEIQHAREQEFIDAHRAELEELLEAARAQTSTN